MSVLKFGLRDRMDDAWKAQIQFAQDMVGVATMWMRSYVDRETCFRFVRSELEERQTHPLDEDIIRQQVEFIRSVFGDSCGYESESTTDTEQDSE